MTIWFDPVCPFSWNITCWLAAVADKTAVPIDCQLMSLAGLNQGRELPPRQQPAPMRDTQQIGRLMTAINRELLPRRNLFR
ncbi:hypothetical protein [Mycobacterium intracellulare]|uniref:mycothiol-dependent nitroreductase Rv2466c family protein n=1 Tax=Mycobacterium intracellulare TaxID=1767 RepID=UPI0006CA6E08